MRGELESKIKEAVKILKEGGIVVFPTDTVYGVGCRIDNEEAIRRVYGIKKRDFSFPFPILLSQAKDLFFWAKASPIVLKLTGKFWPGPLTLILPAKDNVLGILKNRKGAASFRVPDEIITQELIRKVGVPIVGTSANFHSQKPAKDFLDLDRNFLALCDFVIEEKCKLGVESTVLDLTGKRPVILRQGVISEREIYGALN